MLLTWNTISHETKRPLNFPPVVLDVSGEIQAVHQLLIATWTVCFSQDYMAWAPQSCCFLLGSAFPSIGSLLSRSACRSRLSACLKLNRCQSPVDSGSLWIIASYLLLWYDGKDVEGKWGLLLDQAVRYVYGRMRHLLTKVFPYTFWGQAANAASLLRFDQYEWGKDFLWLNIDS